MSQSRFEQLTAPFRSEESDGSLFSMGWLYAGLMTVMTVYSFLSLNHEKQASAHLSKTSARKIKTESSAKPMDSKLLPPQISPLSNTASASPSPAQSTNLSAPPTIAQSTLPQTSSSANTSTASSTTAIPTATASAKTPLPVKPMIRRPAAIRRPVYNRQYRRRRYR